MSKFPSGGNYPETKEDYAQHFVELLRIATPAQLNRAMVDWKAMGGKFAVMAEYLAGFIGDDELDRRLGELCNE